MKSYSKIHPLTLREFNITVAEAIFLDIVVGDLVGERWCTLPKTKFAEVLNMSERGIFEIIKRLINKGLLVKAKNGNLKCTDKYKVHIKTMTKGSMKAARSIDQNNATV